MEKMQEMLSQPLLSISIVSHNQSGIVEKLLQDIAKYCSVESIEIILTLNIPEPEPEVLREYFCPVRLIENQSALGFGANHNQAFGYAKGDFFCVLNPDVRLTEDIFPALLMVIEKDEKIGLVAPQIINLMGEVEDNARNFPSPMEIIFKVFGGRSNVFSRVGSTVIFPDWVAGMFMLFPSARFKQIGGFDERYFLYYEDVDLCARLFLAGSRVSVCTRVKAIHDARRSSHRKFSYLLWHLRSLVYFFWSPVYRKVRKLKRSKIGC